MTIKVEFTPEADADLDRLFDFLLERAETVEEAMRAYEAVAVIREVAARRSWSSSSVRATSAKRTITDLQPRSRLLPTERR